jgi:hypothetical protein
MLRSLTFLLLPVLALCHASAAHAAPVQGLLVDVSKAENADNGQISVLVNGAAANYTVTPDTKFEILRGTQRQGSSFLAEHKGQSVAVFVKPNSNPPTAYKVEVLLPAPPAPPAHVVHTPPKPGHVHGTVVAVDPHILVIHLHHTEPPPPVFGVITDVSKSETSETGSITVKAHDKTSTFVLGPWTQFEQDRGNHHKSSSFLAEHRGEMALIYPRHGNLNLANKVAVILPPDKTSKTSTTTNHTKPQLHYQIYLLNGDTKYSRRRDSHVDPSDWSSVVVGEEVSVKATGIHSHTAATVDVLLPHTIDGHVVSASATGLTIKTHHLTGEKTSPHQDVMITIPLTSQTKFLSVEGKTHSPANLSALKGGEWVVVYPGPLHPHVAETIEMHPTHASTKAVKAVTAKGLLAKAEGGMVLVALHTPAKGGEAFEVFHLHKETTITVVVGKEHKPGHAGLLALGEEVVIHGHSGDYPLADKVEIHIKEVKLPKPTEIKHPKETTKPKPKG